MACRLPDPEMYAKAARLPLAKLLRRYYIERDWQAEVLWAETQAEWDYLDMRDCLSGEFY